MVGYFFMALPFHKRALSIIPHYSIQNYIPQQEYNLLGLIHICSEQEQTLGNI
jgi:hypothetical protein